MSNVFDVANKGNEIRTHYVEWETPDDVTVDNFLLDMAKQTHLLIGGATRSGKSVLLNSFIFNQINYCLPIMNTEENSDRQCGFFLIDPKMGVEFSRFKKLPHTLGFATNDSDAVSALSSAISMMEERYTELTESGCRKYNGKHVYVVIDEMADISGNKQVSALIDRLARLGGAANIHLLLATQQPLITSGAILSSTKANMTAQIALRCEEAKDSRAIIRQAGAELLPLNGFCLYRTPYFTDIQKLSVPYTSDDEIDSVIAFWLAQVEANRPKEEVKPVIRKAFADERKAFCKPERKYGELSNLFYFLTGVRVSVEY